MRDLKKIILHCSSTDNDNFDNIDTIRSWHLDRGFDDIGYHYFIDKVGMVFKGRSLDVIGAHCKGYNKDSIGICLSGLHDFSPMQFVSLKVLLFNLMRDFAIPASEIYPHNEFNLNKTCPNFELDDI